MVTTGKIPNLSELINSSYKRFKSKAEEIGFASSTKLVVKSDSFAFQFSTESDVEIIEMDTKLKEPYVRIEVNHNLLHRLLRGLDMRTGTMLR